MVVVYLCVPLTLKFDVFFLTPHLSLQVVVLNIVRCEIEMPSRGGRVLDRF